MSADLGHWTAPERPVRCRFVGWHRDGSDGWQRLQRLTGRVEIPVLLEPQCATFSSFNDPVAITAPRFGARVFNLHRVTAADHLGPTEAEYREVER